MAHAFDIIDPVELSAFVRELDPRSYGFTLNQWLPDVSHEDVEYAFTRMTERREDVAPYRAFDVEAAIGSRPGFTRVRGEIPPISKKLPLGEEQRLRLDSFRGSDASARVASEIFNDAALLTESILARIEQARGEALTTGKVTFANDPGFDGDVVIDYLAGGTLNAGTALSGTVWTTPATGLPITDLLQWVTDYEDNNNGRRPAAFITAKANIDAALLCDEVTAALYPTTGLGVQFPTASDLNSFLTARDGVPVVAYDTQVSVAGSATRVIPNTKVWALAEPNVANFGETAWGVTAEAMDAVEAGFDTLASAPGLYAIADKTFDPIQTWTKVSGIAVPVVKDVNKFLVSPDVR